jgi:hypothetical protein
VIADGRGDQHLLRLDPFGELEAGGRQFLQHSLQLALVGGKICAPRMGSYKAPQVECFATLEALNANTDQRLVRSPADAERSVIPPDPGRFEDDVGNVLFHLRRNRAVAADRGRDVLLNRAEIDRLLGLRRLNLEGSLVHVRRAAEQPGD